MSDLSTIAAISGVVGALTGVGGIIYAHKSLSVSRKSLDLSKKSYAKSEQTEDEVNTLKLELKKQDSIQQSNSDSSNTQQQAHTGNGNNTINNISLKDKPRLSKEELMFLKYVYDKTDGTVGNLIDVEYDFEYNRRGAMKNLHRFGLVKILAGHSLFITEHGIQYMRDLEE